VTATRRLGYGARPVSMDLTRGHALAEADAGQSEPPVARIARAPLADQLALAHWPAGHTIAVCGLAGGTGRSTVASLVAAGLAELPWAHVHKPIALVELRPRALSTTRARWLAESTNRLSDERQAPQQYVPIKTRSGIVLPPATVVEADRGSFSVVVAEAPVGLPSEHSAVHDDANSSVLLVVRPDRRSLTEAAEALVWMHDQHLVHRSRVVVVVNLGVGQVDRGSRASSTALSVRCRAVHRLASNPGLGPLSSLPSGTALAPQLRRPVSALCLDLWRASQSTSRTNSSEESS